MEIPSARAVAIALHLAAEANRHIERLELPGGLLPQLLRGLADQLEKVDNEHQVEPEVLDR